MAMSVRRRAAASKGEDLGVHGSVSHNGRAIGGKLKGESVDASLSKAVIHLVLILYFLGAALIYHSHRWLPKPKGVDIPLQDFSEARANVHVEKISSFGTRTTGSVGNEIDAPTYILDFLDKVKKEALPGYVIDINVQKPSGSFNLDFIGGFTNIYSNITNVVARISYTGPGAPSATPADHALLMSAHYDSTLGTKATSDDLCGISIMMEILRALSQSPDPLVHAVIFNFNGAEETILQASHGFITQHPWANTIRAFINLEGAGGTGRELLFQTGPKNGWLAKAYSNHAPYPFSNILAQEIFQSGIIPSDTDFRVYRDYGNLPGLDVAFIDNGYIYHTALDDPEHTTPGSLQRCGENMHSVVLELANSSILGNPSTHAEDSVVFLDILGHFAIVYTFSTGVIINCSALALAVVFLLTRGLSLKSLVSEMTRVFIGLLLSIMAAVAVGLLLPVFDLSMVWYGSPYLAVGLFGCPALLTLYGSQLVCRGGKTESQEQRENTTFAATLLLFWLLLLLLTLLSLGSGVYVMQWVLFPMLFRLVSPPKPGLLFTGCYLMGLLVPFVISGSAIVIVWEFFMPLCGRIGTEPQPDVIVAVIMSFGFSVLSIGSISLVHLVKSSHLRVVKKFLLLVVAGSIVLSSFSHPYTPQHPKRILLQHTERRFYDKAGSLVRSDAGIWANPQDYLKLEPVRPYYSAIADLPYVACPENSIYCDMPWYLPIKDMLRGGMFIPLQASEAKPVPVATHVNMQVISDHFDQSTGKRRVHLSVTGPDHITVYIDAIRTPLTNWSFPLDAKTGKPPVSGMAEKSEVQM